MVLVYNARNRWDNSARTFWIHDHISGTTSGITDAPTLLRLLTRRTGKGGCADAGEAGAVLAGAARPAIPTGVAGAGVERLVAVGSRPTRVAGARICVAHHLNRKY